MGNNQDTRIRQNAFHRDDLAKHKALEERMKKWEKERSENNSGSPNEEPVQQSYLTQPSLKYSPHSSTLQYLPTPSIQPTLPTPSIPQIGSILPCQLIPQTLPSPPSQSAPKLSAPVVIDEMKWIPDQEIVFHGPGGSVRSTTRKVMSAVQQRLQETFGSDMSSPAMQLNTSRSPVTFDHSEHSLFRPPHLRSK